MPDVIARPKRDRAARDDRGQRGQIIVITALAMISMIAGVSLIIEGGNAYAHQRVAQNAIDSVANAGATVLAQRLGGGTQDDAAVQAGMSSMAAANSLDSFAGYYTNVLGQLLNVSGVVVTDPAAAARVGPADGDSTIPPATQGVQASGSQTFGTTFARAIGISQFTASAAATAVTGALTGGRFMPIVFPVSMANCDGSGGTVASDDPSRLSDPNPDPNLPPIGQEYIVPLCKTGGGSLQILDLDPSKNCYEEVVNPTSMQFVKFPVDQPVDTGNDCAKKIVDGIADAGLHGTVVLIPICDGQCVTASGSGGTYHLIRIASFYLDYLSDQNSGNNPACDVGLSPNYGTPMVNIVGGNGSSSCMVGWFVRWVTSGPVGSGNILNGEALGIQLIR